MCVAIACLGTKYMYVYMNVCMCMCVYIYIYIYIYKSSCAERLAPRIRTARHVPLTVLLCSQRDLKCHIEAPVL